MYNACLTVVVFSTLWKKARLVLIDKKNAVPSWRPLGILDNDGRLVEALLRPRLRGRNLEWRNLSDRQYGSRQGRSIVGAGREVSAMVEAANRVRHAARLIFLLVTLDVKNAFNTARWVNIFGGPIVLRSASLPHAYGEGLFFTKNVTVRYDSRTKISTLTRGHCRGLSGGP